MGDIPITTLSLFAGAIPFASAVIASVLAWYIWPNRHRPDARTVLVLLSACGIWAFFYGVEIVVADFQLKVFAAQLQYVGIVLVAPSWCIAAIHSSGLSRHLTARRIAMLLVIPFATLAAALTNAAHGLLWRDISLRSEAPHTLEFSYGPVFWINNQYAWLLLIVGTTLLLRNVMMSQPLYRGQRTLMIITVLVPWLANAAYIFKIGPVPGLDLTPCAFVISGFILFFGIVRFKIAGVIPMARHYVLENFNDGLFVIDADNKLIDLNRAGRELLGEIPRAIIGNDVRVSFMQIPALAEILESPPGTTIRIEKNTGSSTKTYDVRMDVLKNGPHGCLGRVVTCRDVTRETEAVAKLQERQNRYRILFEESPIALWLQDFSEIQAYFSEVRKIGVTDWREYFERNPQAVRDCAGRVRVLDVNAQAISQHGALNKNDLLVNLSAVFTRQSFELFRDELVSLADGNTSFHGEAEYKTMSGTVLWLSVNVRVVPGHEKLLERVLISNIDISERKQAEEKRLQLERQIQQTQKLESLGVLAGGIAHDFNNILVAILGNASLTLSDLDPASPIFESMCEIESAAHRAADLCRQMLAYAGKGKFIVEPINLCTTVKAMMPLLRTSVSKKAVLNLNAANDLPAIKADATQIEQVVMNLVINASESLGENVGAIAISIGTESCSREYLRQLPYSETLADGNYVYLEVADSGSGMDGNTVARLFEPFFSTKFAGRGLGMSVVLGIVRGHRGTFDVQSQIGKGTTIRVFFPALVADIVPPLKQTEIIGAAPNFRGSVLLVDDEECVRSVCAKMLERVGVSVLTANDGLMAIQIFEARRNEIGLVLLDFKMPELNGVETFRLLRQIDPDIRVVLSSGYTEDEIEERFSDLGFTAFMQKPYAYESLRARLLPLLGINHESVLNT